MITVGVAGASGYAGGELLRLLLNRTDVRIGALTAGASAGDRVIKHHPHLTTLADRVLTSTEPAAFADHDVVFLALPHGASAALAPELHQGALVIDCAADHRLRDPAAWAQWYGGPFADAWSYGLPELPGQRAVLRDTRRVAVPGCFPTVATVALTPAVAAGLIAGDVVITAVTGVSGAGRSEPRLPAAEVMGAASAYAVGGTHRHTPEIEQNLTAVAGAPVRVSFTPVLAPMSRGIIATCSAPVSAPDAVMATYHDAYQREPFVHVIDSWPTTGQVLGSNSVVLRATVDERLDRLVVVAAIDNLTKGTAGAAVQCMNLALGLPETTGLTTIGVAP